MPDEPGLAGAGSVAGGEPRDPAGAYPARSNVAGLAPVERTRHRWAAMTQRAPEPAVRFDHVAIAVPRVAAVPPFLVGTLGGRAHGTGPGAGFRFWQWEFARGARLEILEPDGPPDGFLHRFLQQRGPGIHHATFKVPALQEAVRRAESHGYQVVGFDDRTPFWKEAFLHPKQAQGIVVQLAEVHPELEPEPSDEWTFPAAPSRPPRPADLLGLRLQARSGDAARGLWEEVLLGRCAQEGAELVFRWPESPLRISVGVEPAGPPGPRGVEVAPRPGLALPEGPHPVLGTAFLPPG